MNDVLWLLFGALAGLVDSIAGGGGLLVLPALLLSGLPPLTALATSKLQGSFGTALASWNYWRHGYVDGRSVVLPALISFCGSLAGVWLVQQLSTELLQQLVPVLLIGVALYFAFARRPGVASRRWIKTFLVVVALVGFYDGFFGPGTGSFFMLMCMVLMSMPLQRAVGTTRVLNFASNLAALLVFACVSAIDFRIGLLLGVGQLFGAYVGSTLAVRHGERLIRPLLVVVSLAVSVTLLLRQST